MEYFALILRLALGGTFLFSGFAKLMAIKASSKFGANMGIFPPKVGAIIGFAMPFIETIVGYLLFIGISNVLLDLFAAFIVVFFLTLNMKSFIEKKQVPCFCFGRIISTKLGIGGAYHYLLLFLFLLTTLFLENIDLRILLLNNSTLEVTSIIFSAAFFFLTGLVMRFTLDLLFE